MENRTGGRHLNLSSISPAGASNRWDICHKTKFPATKFPTRLISHEKILTHNTFSHKIPTELGFHIKMPLELDFRSKIPMLGRINSHPPPAWQPRDEIKAIFCNKQQPNT